MKSSLRLFVFALVLVTSGQVSALSMPDFITNIRNSYNAGSLKKDYCTKANAVKAVAVTATVATLATLVYNRAAIAAKASTAGTALKAKASELGSKVSNSAFVKSASDKATVFGKSVSERASSFAKSASEKGSSFLAKFKSATPVSTVAKDAVEAIVK